MRRGRFSTGATLQARRGDPGWDPGEPPPGGPQFPECPPGFVMHRSDENCSMDGRCRFCGLRSKKDCCNGRQNGAQFFSQWLANPTTDPSTPTLKTYRFLSSPSVPFATRWLVALWGWETQEIATAVNGGPASATNQSAIDFGNPNLHNTFLKARVGFHGASGGTIREIDISRGVRFSVEACMVTIDILYPVEGHVNPFEGNPTTAPTLTGLVLNSIIGGWIAPIVSVPGRQILTNTQTTQLATDSVGAMTVPPGAIELTLYQSSAGNVLSPHWSLRDDDAWGSAADLATQIGEVNLGADRRVSKLNVPGNAKQLLLGGTDVNDTRNLTAVWGLEM